MTNPSSSPPLRVGIGGPVGSGKTTLVEMPCNRQRDEVVAFVVEHGLFETA